MIEMLTALLTTAVLSGGVLAIASVGEVMAERVGVTNLGVEGLISVGAATAVLTAVSTGNPWLALLAATAAGALGGMAFACAAVLVQASQVLCGLAVTFLGVGLSAVIGHSVAGMPAPVTFAPVSIPVLSALPIIGPAFFAQNLLIVPAYILVPAACHYVLFHTRHGLNMRAVGENPAAADAAGIPVRAIRFWYVTLGAALAGAAGAYLSLAVIPSWSEGMVAGRGWIALALVIFAGFRPFNAAAGGLLFGLISAIGFLGQARGWPIAAPVLNMLPYLGTLAFIMLPAVFRRKRRRGGEAPAALGLPYFRSVR
ncbi:amino acid transporter [Acetobacter aceti NRIC 0242]|uniref:ABC transporter permease n=1 Tax=Acetobacter aceti NBRC 14818 TaxID=887700 RepID=A0AB33IIH0_ACEAC|nr:ABC transporter permease [Acetobacter aceti]TCS32721.1 nucleoside ABC transporter membrane protein [Acetobacter aceti NBRC 14818]BCK77384.1 ABC transporter permease [Acetobacter aceti NBRC 14818]GAN58454.1 ABC transporter amino acid permease [Acetobacter aceti NBRC 14818]GBO82130.1 amino acid transporter [Acetobacter aceti NRIC 0242]